MGQAKKRRQAAAELAQGRGQAANPEYETVASIYQKRIAHDLAPLTDPGVRAAVLARMIRKGLVKAG